jgi:Mce-associated membrane protein
VTRDELAPLAAKQIPQVFGYDYQTVERSLNEVYPLLTPDYRQEFRGPREQGHHPAGA